MENTNVFHNLAIWVDGGKRGEGRGMGKRFTGGGRKGVRGGGKKG